MDRAFDVAVAGLGMIGSACARHLAEAGFSVAAVGAAEPPAYEQADGPFASHYDEGRITRIAAFEPVWAQLARRSIERYADIADRSGIDFHVPCGLVVIAPHALAALEIARAEGSRAQRVSPDELFECTGIAVPPSGEHHVIEEGPPAGYINPRRLVAAQKHLAQEHGAAILTGVVERIERTVAGVRLIGPFGHVDARHVVLATGAYGAELVGVELPMQRRLRTIVRADVGHGPELPALIVDSPGHDELECYWVPPVRYPDGRTRLKIGGDSVPLHVAADSAAIAHWFRSGGLATEADSLRETLAALLPGRALGHSDHRPCVIALTETGNPFIDWVDEDIAVAVGGCGAAAKSSDEIGRLAASFVTGAWSESDPLIETFAVPT